MSNLTLIGDFLHRIKRPIELNPDEKYKLVTVRLKHNGVVLRQEKLGSEIKSKMYKVREGDFILSGIDARNGAFGIVPPELDGAIVTNDFWYFDLDESIVDKQFFLELTSTKWFDEICRKGSDGTTQRIRLQKNKFFNQSVFLPSLEKQREFILRFQQIKTKRNYLSRELSQQQILLKKLRQQILQEAIEGKLTEDWRMQNPDIEPASELLARIQAEKTQLIEDKKIKKQKPLAPITEEEKPFALPKGWGWCRLNEIFNFIDYRGKTPHKLKAGIRLLTARNVKSGFLSLEPEDYISKEEYLERMTRGFPAKGDLLFTTEAPLGNICELDINDKKISTGQRLITFQSYFAESINKVHMFFMLSPFYQAYLIEKATGITAKGIKASKLKEMLIPLPPLSEQKAIVTKVEKLLALCDQLESQIADNQSCTEQLMQTVLKEAFQQDKKADTNVISFPAMQGEEERSFLKRKILAAYIINQSLDDTKFGHTKFEKLLHLSEYHTLQRNFNQQYQQKAAGPYDNKFTRSFFAQTLKANWFVEKQFGSLKRIMAGENIEKSQKIYNYFTQEELDKINHLIQIFKDWNYEIPEIVSTLYAVWNNRLIRGEEVNDELLKQDFLSWDEQKSKYKDRLDKALDWMREKEIIPNGWGKLIEKL